MATRNIRPFVHLRVLSSYSLGLGLSTPGDICQHARRVGFDTVALTDVSGTYGFVEFHRAAREVGVKPIYGTLLYIDWSNPPAADDPVQSLILLAIDRTGLKHVCAAATASAIKRESKHGVRIEDLEDITDGVIAIAGLDLDRADIDVRHALAPLRDLYGDRLFVECRDGLSAVASSVQTTLLRDAREAGVPPVLVQDVRFVGPARPQLAELAATGEDASYEHRVFGDPRAGDAGPGHGMRTAADMSGAYDAMPEAHANAALLASLVQPDLFDALEDSAEPSPAIEMFDTMQEQRTTLRTRVLGAMEKRLHAMDGAPAAELRADVAAELDRIERAGVGDRFLQYEEIVRRLRAAGVVIGPGTGLSVQSRCAWLLGITAFDPRAVDPRFDPGFESPDVDTRVLDLQITPEQRPRALATLNGAYDDASIGYVPSVEHITAARALRIVARSIDIPADDFDEAVRIATRRPGLSLRELSEDNRSLGALYRRSAAFRDLVAHAASIEGLPFGFVRTKRTVVVSPRSLRGLFAYTVSPDTGDHFLQATRDSFPVGGIRRIDIDALHVLAWVGDGGDWQPGDPEAYARISDGDLDGVYLLEGRPGALAPGFGVQSFNDLVLFVALLRHRGGGMGLSRRLEAFRGEPLPVPAAACVGEVLADTNGWVLFRDQVRDVLAALTGLPRPEAAVYLARFRDHTPGNLATLRREFFARTVEMSVSFEDATTWFARLLRVAGRTEDRQRVLAECLIIDRCLAFKSARRSEFFARLLDHTVSADKRRRYRGLLEAEGKWLAPDVNRSGRRHRVEAGNIRAPLWDAHGITRETADTIIRMRGDKRFATVEEFRCAAAAEGINLDIVDALVRVGAFDSVMEQGPTGGGHRSPPSETSATADQMDLALGTIQVSGSAHSYPPSFSTPIEKDGNPRHAFRVVASLMEFYPHPSATPVELAGRIRNLHEYRTSSGKAVGFFELFDSSGSVRVFVPWERVVQAGEPLNDGSHVIVMGKVRLRDGRKVCDALEIVVAEGGNGNGETPPDEPSKGDS
ncbi:MAG TPA: PHP domain-containing protein [Candidatus Krumholzibacteria bacterium]|nr:PHP domain-containing protein [Candidatus Krumholzibacteria bacterium]